MTNHKNGCMICGEDLVYHTDNKDYKCHYCGETFSARESCEAGHYVCDTCHSKDAKSFIIDFCLGSQSEDPLELSRDIMKHPSIKMHGPEHHFIVPAVLLTTYYNKTGETKKLDSSLKTALKRSGDVKGGFCGFHGACGAAIGAGIFASIITNATPVSERGFKLSNELTAGALTKIAAHGGPRCCKRDTFLAIKDGMKFLNEKFGLDYEIDTETTCEFYRFNNECKTVDCVFY